MLSSPGNIEDRLGLAMQTQKGGGGKKRKEATQKAAPNNDFFFFCNVVYQAVQWKANRQETKRQAWQQEEHLGNINKSFLIPCLLRTLKKRLHITTILAHAPEKTALLINQRPGMIKLNNLAMIQQQHFIVINNSL